jgi:hypothetical protein
VISSPRTKTRRTTRARRLSRLGAALLALAAFSFAPGAVSSALAADCNVELRDGGDYLFSVLVELSEPLRNGDEYGAFRQGGGPNSGDPFSDWGNVFVADPTTEPDLLTIADTYVGPNECELAQGGREVRFPVVPLKGLQTQRTIFVDSGPLHGARLLTTLRNPGSAPTSVALIQGDPSVLNGNGLNSQQETFAAATSDGTGNATPASAWGVTTNGPPGPGSTSFLSTLAHVWDGPGGAQRISRVNMRNGDPSLSWAWDVTVPAGGTAAFISYEIQQDVPSELLVEEVATVAQQAQARQAQSPATLYQGMSAVEIAATRNWAHPAPTAAIKPVAGANSAQPVVLDGTGSLAAPAGLPQCGIASYAWKADDGATATGPIFSHLFKPGAHKATLTVTSTCGASASAEASFTVASALKLGKVKLNRSKGTATIKVTALVAGKLTLSGKGVKKVSKKLAKPGTATLLVKPTGKVRKRLFARGDAKAKIVISLKPKSGPATSLRKTLPLKLGD